MRFTEMLKRLVPSRWRGARPHGLDNLRFNVIPATDDLYDQDVRPALLAQFLAMKKSG